MLNKAEPIAELDYASYLKYQENVGAIPLIDVRSPQEFTRGSMPGALSLPIFSDYERHEIGAIYKSRGKLQAVQHGLDIFSFRITKFLDELTYKVDSQNLLGICCWRGGFRSQSIASLLKAIGHKVFILKGGYKAYRTNVEETLDQLARRRFTVLNGRTGSGKTELLRQLKCRLPVIDFEELAKHRGSALGGFNQQDPSPTQQNFENLLANEFRRLENSSEILVEIESFIGPVSLPKKIRDSLIKSPMIFLEKDLEHRVQSLVAEYASNWTALSDRIFEQKLELLNRHITASTKASLMQAARVRDFARVVGILLEVRYDPVYDKSLRKHDNNKIASFNLTHNTQEAVSFLLRRFGVNEDEGLPMIKK